MALTTTNALGKRLLDRYKTEPPTTTWGDVTTAHNKAWISDTDYGITMLLAYSRSDATLADLDAALAADWITQAQYDTATAPATPA